jgi:hypothetical protein
MTLDNVIIIPYRDREIHLNHFIENTFPLLNNNLPNTKVIVIEQDDGKKFNRGLLLNIGFKEYQNRTKYFITHDVDIVPTENVIKQVYTNQNSYIYRIKSGHVESLGGIVKLEHDSVFNMNGFPNYIWGWGIEDRALFYRAYIKNIPIECNKLHQFGSLHHKSNAEVYVNDKHQISEIWRKSHIDALNDVEKNNLINESGINNLKYETIERNQINESMEIIKVFV